MCGWHHWLNGHEFWANSEIVKDREGWRATVHGDVKNQTQLSDWTTKPRTRWLHRLIPPNIEWRISTNPSQTLLKIKMKSCCWTTKDTRILGLQRRRIQSGPRDRLDCSELLCDKVLLKCKRDRESFWHRHQNGAERVPCC